MDNTVTLESVLEQARQLTPTDQARLMVEIARVVEEAVAANMANRTGIPQPKRSLYGLWAHHSPGLSAEEIDEARREAWANFPRDDI